MSRWLVASSVCLLFGCDTIKQQIPGCVSNDTPPPAEGTAASGQAANGTGAGPVGQVSVLAEAEPNNDAATAMPLPLDRPVQASLAGGDTIDVFSMPAGAQDVSIEVAATGPLSLQVSRVIGGANWTRDIAAGETVTVGPVSRQGAFNLSVTGAGTYTLHATASARIACGFANEPDSEFVVGATIAEVPGRVDGCIRAQNDADFFHIDGEAIRAHRGFALEVSGIPDVALRLSVRDADGLEMLTSSGLPGQGVSVPNIGPPLAPGPVLVVVSSVSGEHEGVPYTLSVRPLGATPVTELEPNDPESPTVIVGATSVQGWIHDATDIDAYRITSPSPLPVRVFVEPVAMMDLQVQRQSPTPGLPPMVRNEAPVGGAEVMCALGLSNGSAFEFEVSSATESVIPGATRYNVVVESVATEQYETEPNDGPGDRVRPTANMPPGMTGIWRSATEFASTLDGHIFPSDDVDRFIVEVVPITAGDMTPVTLLLSVEPRDMIDMSLRVLDDEGFPLGTADNGTVAEAESIQLDVPPGRYFVELRGEGEATCGPPYQLSVTSTRTAPLVPMPMVNGTGGSPTTGSGATPPTLGIPNGIPRPERLNTGEGGLNLPTLPRPNQPRPAPPGDLEPSDLQPR